MDNGGVLRDFAVLPLSSVILNSHRTGHGAAALFDRTMNGGRIGTESYRIELPGVGTDGRGSGLELLQD